jgi:hypothetical protein
MRFLLPLLLLLPTVAWADVLLNYNGFYGRMKKLQQAQYSDITLAFALTSSRCTEVCKFYSLKLISQEHDIALQLAQNNEIMLPYDEALKNANAAVQVLQADNAAPCQVEMRLRSRLRLPQELTLQQLQHFRHQFELLLDDMAGLSKYWLPEVVGVIAEFDQSAQLADVPSELAAVTHCEQQRCYIRLDTLAVEQGRWLFTQRPRYLLPLLASDAE